MWELRHPTLSGYLAIGEHHLSLHLYGPGPEDKPPFFQSGFRRYRVENDRLITENLLGVINRLVDAGNTIVVIEHNLDVIKTADWIIEIGPEGGRAGGRILATGTPEQIAATKTTATGSFLAELL